MANYCYRWKISLDLGNLRAGIKERRKKKKKRRARTLTPIQSNAVKAFLGADEDMMKLGTYDNLATWQKSWWNSETNLVTVFEQHQICERRKRGANRELALQGWIIWVGVVWVREREGRVRGCRRGGERGHHCLNFIKTARLQLCHRSVTKMFPPLQSRAPEGSQARIAGVLHHWQTVANYHLCFT